MLADSYKYSHSKQYPKGMVSMYDYMESRGGKYGSTVFAGLQGLLKTYFDKPITIEEVNQAKAFAELHGIPFDIEGWEYIIKELGGKLPVKIRAVPEGSVVPNHNVLMTVESTDPKVPWVAGWLETFLMKIWYPINIATKSAYVKKILMKYGSKEWAEFAYHNFGDRGSSTVEAAAIGGFAHLIPFRGTDNFNSLKYAFDNYFPASGKVTEVAGFSVFATEHSTTTSHGKAGEIPFVIKQLEQNPDAQIMSFVADSYDVFKFTNEVTMETSYVRNLIESRGQKLVIRPDSGDPIQVINKILDIMMENDVPFERVNNKILFKNYGILWGDGISPETIGEILAFVTGKGFAAENFVFGSGGDLMQNHSRDTQKFAIKCSSITLEDGTEVEVFKDPITDPGKKSKKGKVTTYFNTESKQFFTDLISKKDEFKTSIEILEDVWVDGEFVKETSLKEIREVFDPAFN